MQAAYYEIKAQEGATYRLKTCVYDKSKTPLNLVNPLPPEEFEEVFPLKEDGTRQVVCYARMQVRGTVDGAIIDVNTPSEEDNRKLKGTSGVPSSVIKLTLTEGTYNGKNTNLIITISANDMAAVDYGKHLYDLELVFSPDTIDNPNSVVWRVLEGRFVITPNITR
jgi:hypothetical protein